MQQLSDDWHVEYEASNRADGLILLGYGDYVTYGEKLAALARAHTRFLIWGPTVPDQPGHSVGCDNSSGGYQACKHLLACGRPNIAFLGNTSEHCPEFAARYDGYCKALRGSRADASATLKVDADNVDDMGGPAIDKLVSRGVDFDAVFAVTDVIAIDAMRALQAQGLNVPRDVSVVGFDDLQLAAYVTPALTTVRQDVREAGESLVASIVGLIEGKQVESTLMEPRLIIRESCGARR